MKLFEEFENDLRDVNSVKGLFKAMLANGIKNIDVDDDDRVITVTEFSLIENVPQEKWMVENNRKYDVWIVVWQDNIKFQHYVSDKECFTEKTGFEFPEVAE